MTFFTRKKNSTKINDKYFQDKYGMRDKYGMFFFKCDQQVLFLFPRRVNIQKPDIIMRSQRSLMQTTPL